MVNYIRHVEENIEGEPSDPEAFETGARVIVYASDAVRELQDSFHIGVQNWAAVSAGDSISDSDIDDWASFTYFCHDMLSKQIRAELSAGMVSMQTLDGLNSIDVIRDSPANRSPKQRKNFLVARFGVNIQRKV
ncbi:hypothetical protein [Nonomuraea glycinis]|uniref:hypothetical protein n=1 Tax=Nonomuraea glycinis TaxID=2047744 RepID=UPI0033B6EB70